MLKGLLVAIAVVLGGCGVEIDESRLIPAPEGADQAIAAIMGVYGGSPKSVPHIYWYGPSGDSKCPAVVIDGACRDGSSQNHFLWAGDQIVVVFLGDRPLSETALAHEIAHIRFDAWNGHPQTWFGDYDRTGVDGGVVRKAMDAVAALGL